MCVSAMTVTAIATAAAITEVVDFILVVDLLDLERRRALHSNIYVAINCLISRAQRIFQSSRWR